MTETWTERMLLDRLHARHSRRNVSPGNGPQWAYMEHVRSHSGFDAQSTIDALAIHLWRSRQHEVHAFEVKVSLSDFRRELADDRAKSAIWREWVGQSARHCWARRSLLVTRGDGLRVMRGPKRLREKPLGWTPCPPIPRTVVASMLRSCAKTTQRASDPSRFQPAQEFWPDFADDEAANA